METLVLKFVAGARAAGMRISTSEVLDCLQHLECIDVLDESQFAAVLRSNFAKSRREQHHFDRLFHLYFHELRQDVTIAHSESLLDRMHSALDRLEAGTGADSGALIDFLRGEPLRFLEGLRQIGSGEGAGGSGLGGNLGAVTRRLGMMLQINRIENALHQYFSEHRADIDWEARRDLMGHFGSRLESARRLLARNQTPPPRSSAIKQTYEQHLKRLGETHFASLTPREVESMREVISQLVRKLKDAVGRRYTARRRGVLDVKRTLRRAASFGGYPLEICHRRRPRRKANIVTLCDVSGSVWSAARFMLNMLYSMQECFTQVRSFIFVAGLEEVTDIFETCEINRAIEKVLKEAELEYGAPTDYGLTFRQFRQQYLDVLNKKTTLIIIGDGRSNYGNPEERILEKMHDRCRRLIWLNPETRQFWYSGDSEMRTFEAYCDEVRPCQNLNQLTEFIRALVL